MLAIRLQRNGRSGYAVYRIVVQEASRHPLSGRVVAELGSYNPHTKTAKLNKELVEKFLSNGAQPSTRVAYLLDKEGIKLPSWVKLAPKKSGAIRKADKLRKNQPAEEAPVEEPVAGETPAAEEVAPAAEPATEEPVEKETQAAEEAAPTEEPAA
ncbi:30S ribosomal protein S16 [Candidatus Saccharibacteria bacterium]|nr:30S ribosomal protein S16 [Candidatus Saccharibacteria bacterium]